MDANKYFELKAIDTPHIRRYIPELINVLSDLKELRMSDDKTHDYIYGWRQSKIKRFLRLPNKEGEIVECEHNNPDTSKADFCCNLLFEYLKFLYDTKEGATIDFAFALFWLTIQFNRQKNTLWPVDLPNVNFLDVMEAIDFGQRDTTENDNKSTGNQSLIDEPALLSDNQLNNLESAGLLSSKYPIQWDKKKISLCAYFVDCYFSKSHPNDLWMIAQEYFNVKNLAQSKTTI